MVFPLKFRLAVGIHSNHSCRCPLHPLTQLVIWSWGWRVISCSTTVWSTLTLTWLIEACSHCEFLAWAYLNLVHKPSAIQFWLPTVCENECMGWDKPEPAPYYVQSMELFLFVVYMYMRLYVYSRKKFCAHWVESVDCTMPHALASAWDFLLFWHTWCSENCLKLRLCKAGKPGCLQTVDAKNEQWWCMAVNTKFSKTM